MRPKTVRIRYSLVVRRITSRKLMHTLDELARAFIPHIPVRIIRQALKGRIVHFTQCTSKLPALGLRAYTVNALQPCTPEPLPVTCHRLASGSRGSLRQFSGKL
jgi:hypothetical protein